MVKIMKNPIKIDDLGVPLFLETSIFGLKKTLKHQHITGIGQWRNVIIGSLKSSLIYNMIYTWCFYACAGRNKVEDLKIYILRNRFRVTLLPATTGKKESATFQAPLNFSQFSHLVPNKKQTPKGVSSHIKE